MADQLDRNTEQRLNEVTLKPIGYSEAEQLEASKQGLNLSNEEDKRAYSLFKIAQGRTTVATPGEQIKEAGRKSVQTVEAKDLTHDKSH